MARRKTKTRRSTTTRRTAKRGPTAKDVGVALRDLRNFINDEFIHLRQFIASVALSARPTHPVPHTEAPTGTLSAPPVPEALPESDAGTDPAALVNVLKSDNEPGVIAL